MFNYIVCYFICENLFSCINDVYDDFLLYDTFYFYWWDSLFWILELMSRLNLIFWVYWKITFFNLELNGFIF